MNFISNFNWRPTLSGIALSLLLATGCAQRHNTLSEQEIADFLEPRKIKLLERELGEWCEDRSIWPSPLSPALFDAWIEVRFHGEVTVLGGED